MPNFPERIGEFNRTRVVSSKGPKTESVNSRRVLYMPLP